MRRLLAILLTAALTPAIRADEDVMTGFAEPKAAFSPVPIWWWSGAPIEKDRLTEQLERMAAGGIHNAIVLNLAPSGPLYGSAADEPPFLSDPWWELFAHTVREGKRLGVHIWFYDQLGFSGSGLQARVVRDHPEFRGIELRREVRDTTGPAEIEIAVPPDGTVLAAFTAKRPVDGPDAGPKWIWNATAMNTAGVQYFRRTFDLDTLPESAEARITCDNGYILFVNGRKIGEESTSATSGWNKAERFDVTRHLRKGRNVIAVRGEDLGPPAGLLFELVFRQPGGKKETRITSGASFRTNAAVVEGWTLPEFDDANWAPAHVIGAPPVQPWGVIAGLGAADLNSLGTPLTQVRRLDATAIQDGVLRVRVPEGPHQVQLYYTASGGFDYHNPAAGAALIDVVHGAMERRFKDELGKTIAGSFQDEFPPMPRFSKRLLAEFRARCGYDLLDHLPALFDAPEGAVSPDSVSSPSVIQVRCDAARVAAELCEDAFFIPLYKWHERFGMLCGYDQTVRNADPVGGEGYYVDYFRTMRHYSVPGNDQSGDAKPHQSIADLYERPRVWMEGFHSSGWGQTPEEVMTLLHAWMAQGSTLYNPHAIYYSTHGSFYEWAPPDTGWRQPYFVHYRPLADYVSRLCWMFTRGRHVAPIAVLHPATTTHAYAGFAPALPAATQAGQLYWEVQSSLRADRMDYIIIDEDSIARADVKDGQIVVGHARIRAVVLPGARVLGEATFRKLVQFAQNGGTVLIAGPAPDSTCEHEMPIVAFKLLASRLRASATLLEDPARTATVLTERLGRDLAQRLPYQHRKLQDRDLYFVLSDDGNYAHWNGQYEINGRKLWEHPAARGQRLVVDVAAEGIPEQYDALTGQVRPVLNYRRTKGRTYAELDLAGSPAALFAIRPADPAAPTAIESNLMVTECRREGNEVVVRGWPQMDRGHPDPTQYAAQVRFADDAFRGIQPAAPPARIDIPGPLACRLDMTMNNAHGDFAWPPSTGPLPVEVRSFKYAEETAGPDATDWTRPDFDDAKWETVVAGYGPRAIWMGPITIPLGQTFETMQQVPGIAGKINILEYSLKLGINEDPIYPTALGGKGRIPEEFIDLGGVSAGLVFMVRAVITAPVTQPLRSILRVGGEARKRAFLNGQAVQFDADPAARVLRAPVALQPGENTLDLLVTRNTNGRLRLFYHFLPLEGNPPDPHWIWTDRPSPSGRTLFTRRFEVPGDPQSAGMVVALGAVHKIRLNGKLIADQGNFEPYFMGRAERYDLLPFVITGENLLEIEAHDTGAPIGMILDGLVRMQDRTAVTFVSDASFLTRPAGASDSAAAPARILAGPSQGYLGETATLLLYPRPHPLPEGGYLLDQRPPPAPFDRLVYATGDAAAKSGFYRFTAPPGAMRMHLRLPRHDEKTTRQIAAFVDGHRIELSQDETGGYTAKLPAPEAPRRVVALRIEQVPGFTRGAALSAPITFDIGPGRIPLGSWDELGLPHYAGALVYTARTTLPDTATQPKELDGAHTHRVWLDLGRVRGVADVTVNGKSCGTRLWHPYRFDISQAATPGENTIEIRAFNTLGPHFGVGHPSWHVFENQTKSGVFGPITVETTSLVEMRLRKVSSRQSDESEQRQ